MDPSILLSLFQSHDLAGHRLGSDSCPAHGTTCAGPAPTPPHQTRPQQRRRFSFSRKRTGPTTHSWPKLKSSNRRKQTMTQTVI